MVDIPYLKRKTQHRIGNAGRKSEARLAKEFGGRERPASGAMVGAKGDIDLGDFLLEAKSTVNASLSVKLDWLIKISKEAMMEGKTPALSVSFVDDDGKAVKDGAWVLIPAYKFHELSESSKE